MKIIKGPITLSELNDLAQHFFMTMVKAVVDVERAVMAIDAEMHADEEALLIQNGSKQENLWGINLYPENKGDGFIEFDSMINIKPRQNNRSRSVENSEVRSKIRDIVNVLVTK